MSRRAPTATFHDSKHSIIHMQYEPTRGWLLTSGTDKVIKVGHCSHTRVWVYYLINCVWRLKSFKNLWCLHAAMGHDSSGIMRIISIVCKQELRVRSEPEPWRTFRVQVPFHGQLHLMVEKLKDIMRFNWWFKLSMCICMYLCMCTWVMETNM